MDYITIEIADMELELIPLHELPGLKVLKVLSMPPDMQRLKMSVDLIKIALRDPQDWNGKIKFMSMRELMDVVDQWMEKSQQEANRQAEEKEYLSQMMEEDEYYYEPPEADIEPEPPFTVDPNELYRQFLTYLEEEKENNKEDDNDQEQ